MSEMVECLSGFAYEDRPFALTWESQRQEIIRILAEWRTPQDKFFLVWTASDKRYRLVYHIPDATWQVEQA
jgi:hypothetical protein